MKVTIDSYQDISNGTAIFPQEMAVSYLGLGLIGEVGELCDKLKKVVRDKGEKSFDEAIKESASDICKEVGDVFWYMAQTCDKVYGDVKFKDLTDVPFVEVRSMSIFSLARNAALEICLAVSRFETKFDSYYHLTVAMTYLNEILSRLDSSIEKELQNNIDKLYSRKERGVLGGSGDSR